MTNISDIDEICNVIIQEEELCLTKIVGLFLCQKVFQKINFYAKMQILRIEL